MSAEVLFNEVWTKDHNLLLPPPLPLFHLPSISAPRATKADRQSYKDVQWATHQQAPREKVMVELMGKNKVLFIYIFHYSFPPSIIMWSQPEQITGPGRDTLKIFSLFTWRGMWWEAGQAGFEHPLARSLFTPTHNKLPQISGSVVQEQPFLLMAPKLLCLSMSLHAFQHGGVALTKELQQHTLDVNREFVERRMRCGIFSVHPYVSLLLLGPSFLIN